MVKLRKRMSFFDIANYVLMLLVIVVTLYPFLLIIFSSISDPLLVMRNEIKLLPRQMTLVNYKLVFATNNITIAYLNTLKYTFVGTAINIMVTFLMAYPLSRKRFIGRKILMKLITFTLLFNGGLIPTFLVVRQLKLYNTIWAVVLLGAVSTWNLIITRSFLESLPDSLEESAIIDGCNDLQVFYKIFLPLSTPIIATMILFYAVGHWNNFFTPLIYLQDKSKFPLQIFLRNLLISGEITQYQNSSQSDNAVVVAQSIKYTVITVTTLPIICVYPFLQKYFVKGVMIGAIKG